MSAKQQRKKQLLRKHVEKWHPNLSRFAPRGNSDPTRMEQRLKDALQVKMHGDVKIYTQEEIHEFQQNREKHI